jgi:hypothetical protein
MAICARAHAGMIRARAERFVRAERPIDSTELPPHFWWAGGHDALQQDWKTGDFETWIDHKLHLQAFGVSFLRSQIEKLIPDVPAPAAPQPPAASVALGGRPPAEFWDELWIEIFGQIYLGKLKPKTQAEITKAMLTWIEQRGEAKQP